MNNEPAAEPLLSAEGLSANELDMNGIPIAERISPHVPTADVLPLLKRCLDFVDEYEPCSDSKFGDYKDMCGECCQEGGHKPDCPYIALEKDLAATIARLEAER